SVGVFRSPKRSGTIVDCRGLLWDSFIEHSTKCVELVSTVLPALIHRREFVEEVVVVGCFRGQQTRRDILFRNLYQSAQSVTLALELPINLVGNGDSRAAVNSLNSLCVRQGHEYRSTKSVIDVACRRARTAPSGEWIRLARDSSHRIVAGVDLAIVRVDSQYAAMDSIISNRTGSKTRFTIFANSVYLGRPVLKSYVVAPRMRAAARRARSRIRPQIM